MANLNNNFVVKNGLTVNDTLSALNGIVVDTANGGSNAPTIFSPTGCCLRLFSQGLMGGGVSIDVDSNLITDADVLSYGTLSGACIVKTGGTSSQFLKQMVV